MYSSGTLRKIPMGYTAISQNILISECDVSDEYAVSILRALTVVCFRVLLVHPEDED